MCTGEREERILFIHGRGSTGNSLHITGEHRRGGRGRGREGRKGPREGGREEMVRIEEKGERGKEREREWSMAM